jgi:hypothetical protein
MNTERITGFSSPLFYNMAALLLRVGFGILMIQSHGYAKLMHFQEFKTDFVDYMGLGMEASLSLAIFTEFFCSDYYRAGYPLCGYTINFHSTGHSFGAQLGADRGT